MKQLTKIGLLALATAFVASTAPAQDLTTVNAIMPKQRSANYFPLIVGEALGYFEEEGISVNLLPSETPIPFVNFVRNGEADIAMMDPAEVLTAVAAGAEIKVIYEVMQTAPDGIAVADQSSVQDMAALKGQTVGLVTERDMVTMKIALDAVGLTEADVTPVVVGEAGPTLAAAFRDQTVAAIAGSGPDWLAIRASGQEIRLITPPAVSNKPGNTFVVSAAATTEKRELLEGFMRAWSKGMYVAQIDPEVVAKIAQTAVPEEWEDANFGQQYLNNAMRLNVSVTENKGDLQTEIWSGIQPAMIKFGVIGEAVEPSVFLDPSFIGPANDWSAEEVQKEVADWRAANM
ncbi:MAG: ABC transporter substrate-binding protein [Cypionkella sp.]|nr:ABC transporter substrate-binding protein [Cypionkella sp.]